MWFIVIFGGAAVAAVLQRLGRGAGDRRYSSMRALARSLGCEFDPIAKPGTGALAVIFPAFHRGENPTWLITITGVWKSAGHPFPVTMGNFQYEIRERNSTIAHQFSYLSMRLPFPDVPDLVIRRAGVLDRAASALGFERIALESEEFNRRFVVESPNRKFAYDAVSPRAMKFMLEGEAFGVEIRGGFCCMDGGRDCWQPEEFRARLRWLERFIAMWPPFLVDNLDFARE